MKKSKVIILSLLAVLLIGAIIWIIWGNLALELTSYTISKDEIPESFSGFRIVQVSDLHNDQMGKNNQRLIDMIDDAEPDIIAITGDLVDSRDTNVEIALDFAKKAVEIAPCYYVSGNHEQRVPEAYEELKSGLEDIGVDILSDEKLRIEHTDGFITLMGIEDPSFRAHRYFSNREVVNQKLLSLSDDNDGFTVLLSHRPELLTDYSYFNVDLVLTGHAHGGQFRLPFVGGLYAPDQGVLPEYESGVYSENDTEMIVSRGVGNSLFPFRINNRPEVVVVELKSN